MKETYSVLRVPRNESLSLNHTLLVQTVSCLDTLVLLVRMVVRKIKFNAFINITNTCLMCVNS